MNSELQTINQRIAERVGKELIDLIPEDQWQEMVDKEITKIRQETGPKIIEDLLKEAYLEKVKATLDKLIITPEWDSMTQEYINKDLERFIGASAGSIFAGMLSPSMQMVLQDLRSRLGY